MGTLSSTINITANRKIPEASYLTFFGHLSYHTTLYIAKLCRALPSIKRSTSITYINIARLHSQPVVAHQQQGN